MRKLAILCAALAFGCAGETGTPTGLASTPAFNVVKNAATSNVFEVKLSCSKVAVDAYWRPTGETTWQVVACGNTATYMASVSADSVDFYFDFFQSTTYRCPPKPGADTTYFREALTVRAKCYPDGTLTSHGQALATFTAKHATH